MRWQAFAMSHELAAIVLTVELLKPQSHMSATFSCRYFIKYFFVLQRRDVESIGVTSFGNPDTWGDANANLCVELLQYACTAKRNHGHGDFPEVEKRWVALMPNGVSFFEVTPLEYESE